MIKTISQALDGWDDHDLGNLGALLGLGLPTSPAAIEDSLKWLYHSKAAANAQMAALNLKAKWIKQPLLKNINALKTMPSYDELLLGACKHMKASEANASISDHEMFLAHAVIIAALQAMSPRQRSVMLTTIVDPAKVCASTNIPGNGLGGPATTLGLLGAAQASGFGVFAAATTALGFLTHAVGVTLPFVVYTGLSSTIAFVIGPVGWLSVGLWGAWTMTKAEWKKITPALVYIIARNARVANGTRPS